MALLFCLCGSWVLGDLVCKLYHFVHSLSYTASIFILVVICTERYFAIIHPITCKQILTPRRLRVSDLPLQHTCSTPAACQPAHTSGCSIPWVAYPPGAGRHPPTVGT